MRIVYGTLGARKKPGCRTEYVNKDKALIIGPVVVSPDPILIPLRFRPRPVLVLRSEHQDQFCEPLFVHVQAHPRTDKLFFFEKT